VPAVVGLVDDRCHAYDSRVVDEDVEPTEALLGGLDGRVPVLGGGDVEAQEVGVVAGGPEFAGARLARVLEDVAEDDAGALLGEAAAVCRALSPCAARDERRLAGKPRGHPWIIRWSRRPREVWPADALARVGLRRSMRSMPRREHRLAELAAQSASAMSRSSFSSRGGPSSSSSQSTVPGQ
jgi:hypothetical protein